MIVEYDLRWVRSSIKCASFCNETVLTLLQPCPDDKDEDPWAILVRGRTYVLWGQTTQVSFDIISIDLPSRKGRPSISTISLS